MNAITLFEQAVNAAPESADGTRALEQARADAEAVLTEARTARDAAAQRAAHLVAVQLKLNIQLAKLNSELATVQPVVAKNIIDAIDTANAKTDIVSSLRACTKKRAELAESIGALNVALDFLVTRELPAAGVKSTEASIQYTRSARDWLLADAYARLHTLRVAMGPLLLADENATISLDENSLAAQFVRKLSELDLTASTLSAQLERKQQHFREVNGGITDVS